MRPPCSSVQQYTAQQQPARQATHLRSFSTTSSLAPPMMAPHTTLASSSAAVLWWWMYSSTSRPTSTSSDLMSTTWPATRPSAPTAFPSSQMTCRATDRAGASEGEGVQCPVCCRLMVPPKPAAFGATKRCWLLQCFSTGHLSVDLQASVHPQVAMEQCLWNSTSNKREPMHAALAPRPLKTCPQRASGQHAGTCTRGHSP
jgi:hypothetical protein